MLICPSCGAALTASAKFCSACGARLPERPVREMRKLVTVLFCDLVGSTAMAERADAKVVREVVAAFFAHVTTTVERHGGAVVNSPATR